MTDDVEKRIAEAATRLGIGKFAPDDDYAGWGNPLHQPADEVTESHSRRIVVTPASSIKPRAVHWLWKDRIAIGTLALIVGRPGLGKSTVGYWLAAQLTRGHLPGDYHGQPRTVLVCATEDPWEQVIIPRLMAAGADLDLVQKIEARTAFNTTAGLNLPQDNAELERIAVLHSAALIIFDPLISRLSANLDTHKDADVRQGLEPIVDIAEKAGAAVLGIMHFNKSGGADPLTALMGSTAFGAVARSLSVVVPDGDEGQRLFATPKNNLGRTDLPSRLFTIESVHIDADDTIPAYTGAVRWHGETDRTAEDAMQDAADGGDARSAAEAAAEWLLGWLTDRGGEATPADAKAAGHAAGHSVKSLLRACKALGVTVVGPTEFSGSRFWRLPTSRGGPVAAIPGETATTDNTDTTGQSQQSRQSQRSPARPPRLATRVPWPGDTDYISPALDPSSQPALDLEPHRFNFGPGGSGYGDSGDPS